MRPNGALDEADARYLEEIGRDCAGWLGPGASLLDLAATPARRSGSWTDAERRGGVTVPGLPLAAAAPWVPASPTAAARFWDFPVRARDLLLARLARRNPPMQPWRRRGIGRWQTDHVGPGPGDPPARDPLLLFAVTAVWNEGDVIHATVTNLFDQGVDRVYVLDDDSDDETVGEAAAAGATVVRGISDGVYDEQDRGRRIRRLIAEQTGLAGGDAWWVVVDADEFPRGPSGRSIRQVVEQLPGWVDVAGSRVLDHLPSAPAAYRPRTHPVRSQPLAQWYRSPYCPQGHWKHQLLRVREGDDLLPLPGHHVAAARDGRRVREAAPSLLMHHVPLRNRDRTEARLRRAAAPGGRYARSPDPWTRWRVAQRLASLDDIYAGRWDQVPCYYAGQPRSGARLRDWRALVGPDERGL